MDLSGYSFERMKDEAEYLILRGCLVEIEMLLEAFHRVASQGTTELMLVSGYSGVGKSSVVNELQKALVRSRGPLVVSDWYNLLKVLRALRVLRARITRDTWRNLRLGFARILDRP